MEAEAEQVSEIMTLPELAKFLRVHPSTLYKMLKRKEVPSAFRVGTDWRFHRPTIAKWVHGLASSQEE